MPRHVRVVPVRRAWSIVLAMLAIVGPLVLVSAVVVAALRQETPECANLKIVTASSFAPVIEGLAPSVAEGEGCARLDVTVADGRAAASQAAALGADLWIPDDAAWAGVADPHLLAAPQTAGAGTVVASSPLYMVTDDRTAKLLDDAGGGWLELANLVAEPGSGVRLAANEPAASGDGMLALGAVGEGVWLDAGMDASADALAAAVPATRLVTGANPSLPARQGEVGLVPERALMSELDDIADLEVLAPTDHTATLRYSWQPSAQAAADPVRAAALDRLSRALAAPQADPLLARAGLRRPAEGPPPGFPPGRLPAVTAPPFEVLGPHHVDHVFATWYAEDRRSDVLVAVDVSGSMWAQAAGSDEPLINVVREGIGGLAGLLPDDARFELWEFATLLDPPRDHRVILPGVELGARRDAVKSAVTAIRPNDVGTGLHDTVLAAYVAARDAYRPGVPSHVVVFTDGRNEADEPTLTVAELTERLAAAADPARPVQLAVVTFGPDTDAEVLTEALEPVGGYVDRINTADDIGSVFIHVAAGGLHG